MLVSKALSNGRGSLLSGAQASALCIVAASVEEGNRRSQFLWIVDVKWPFTLFENWLVRSVSVTAMLQQQ